MKRYTYTLSIISAGILTVLFLQRGSYLAAALAVGALVFYGYGLVQDIRYARSGKSGSAGLDGGGIDSSSPDGTINGKGANGNGKNAQAAAREAALAELRALHAQYSRQMRIFRNASVTLSLIAAMLVFVNESLAIAILIVALFALFKFWQNLRAVRLIRKGAGDQLQTPPAKTR